MSFSHSTPPLFILFFATTTLKQGAWRYAQTGNGSMISWTTLTEESWQFADEATKTLFERVRTRCSKTLGSVAEIFVGVQTSADDVYIVRAKSEAFDHIMVHWNDRDWPIERSILRPCLHDVTIHPYSRPIANSWMIFPYELVRNIKGKTEARLIQPKQFQQDFPGCFAYLKARRNELAKRSVIGGSSVALQWYQYGRSQSLTKFGSPKIILPILSTEARYGYDDANTIVTGGGNGPYYLIRPSETIKISLNYLLAILNHPLSEAFVRTNTSTFRGGYYSHGKQFIENLPIPEPSIDTLAEINGLVTELIRVNSEANTSKIPHHRTAKEREAEIRRANIEARVSALFELSESDLETVRLVPIPN